MTIPPLDRSTIWPYENGEPGEYHYARYGNPLAFLRPGATIALAEGAYYGTSLLFRELEPWGLRFVEFDQTGVPPDGVDLVWLEAPSNPFLTMPDLDAAARHPARVLVDSTASTPVYLRALERGADYVLHSATKYLTGHHDAVLGAVACRDAGDAERLGDVRGRTGIVATPEGAWLLQRGLATLDVRMRRHTESATAIAERLAAHEAVERVRYPGFGGLLSFDVAGGAAAAGKVETGTRTIANATSLGGAQSTLETRRRWEGERAPENLVRLSVGLEPLEELWDDLNAALSR